MIVQAIVRADNDERSSKQPRTEKCSSGLDAVTWRMCLAAAIVAQETATRAGDVPAVPIGKNPQGKL
jgi:hypothetical protein